MEQGPQRRPIRPRDFLRATGSKGSRLLCLTPIPVTLRLAHSHAVLESFRPVEHDHLVQGTAVYGPGLFAGQDICPGPLTPRGSAALVGTDAVADQTSRLMGSRTARSAVRSGEDERHGLRHDLCDRGSGARGRDRECLRPGAEGHARRAWHQAYRRVDSERRKGPRRSFREARSAALTAVRALQALRALRAAQARTPRWWSRHRSAAPVSPNPSATRSCVRCRSLSRRSGGAFGASRPSPTRLTRSRATHRRLCRPGSGQRVSGRGPDPQLPIVFQTLETASPTSTSISGSQPLGDQPASGRREDERCHQPRGRIRTRRQAGDPGGCRPAQPADDPTHGTEPVPASAR